LLIILGSGGANGGKKSGVSLHALAFGQSAGFLNFLAQPQQHVAGLDVSVKETSICIVDDTGRIVREVKVASEPEALLQVLGNPIYRFKRIGLEAGPLSQWLFSALAEAGLGMIIRRSTNTTGSRYGRTLSISLWLALSPLRGCDT
jgi:hypothetical protein